MSGEINWGEPIAVEGNRPEWLAVDQVMQYRHRVDRDGEWVKGSAQHWKWSNLDWQCVVAIRLPADHPHYATQETRTAPSGGEVGPEVVERLRASHAMLLDRIERNQCEHENTHRGGAIWTICEDCGEKWADDRGGFQPYVAPDWLVEAREVATALLPEPVDADEQWARDLIREQGWSGERVIGSEAVVHMIAMARRGHTLESEIPS